MSSLPYVIVLAGGEGDGVGHFSRAVLSQAERLTVIPVEGSGWSDWGSPQRVLASLAGSESHSPLARKDGAAQRERRQALIHRPKVRMAARRRRSHLGLQNHADRSRAPTPRLPAWRRDNVSALCGTCATSAFPRPTPRTEAEASLALRGAFR
jgi:hypothetical protein